MRTYSVSSPGKPWVYDENGDDVGPAFRELAALIQL